MFDRPPDGLDGNERAFRQGDILDEGEALVFVPACVQQIIDRIGVTGHHCGELKHLARHSEKTDASCTAHPVRIVIRRTGAFLAVCSARIVSGR